MTPPRTDGSDRSPGTQAPRSRRWIGALAVLLLAPALVVGGLVVQAARLPSRQVQVEPVPVAVDVDAASRNLADALALPTVSRQGGAFETQPFDHLEGLLIQRFPRVHDTLVKEVVAGHSLLFTWPGTDPTLAPLVLMGHTDVVPATDEGWEVPPFSGRIDDGWIWGRGALDDKHNVLGQLEAVEHWLAQGYTPARTVHLAYGHDEEVGGEAAAAIAALLMERGQRPWMVLDEGGSIVTDAIDGLSRPAALIGIAEKGYATIELIARGEGGHSSMPPPSTASGRIGAAVARIEANPMPASVRGPAAMMMDWLAPEMAWPMRAVFGNRRLLGPVIARQMTRKPSTNALLRTTTAVTLLSGSTKENVLPTEARAAVNFRILPGDTSEDVLAHVRRVVADESIEVRLGGDIRSEPSPVSRVDGPAFESLQRAIRETYPEAVVAPYLVLGATDARHYAPHSDAVYRFSPTLLSLADLSRIHGFDERIGVDEYGRLVGFYVRLIAHATAGEG